LSGRGAHAFPKGRRLRKRREFLPVQDGGSRISLPSCIVLLAARSDQKPARLGITVTRKFGDAVRRNRAKRLVREVFRRLPGLFPAGIDVVVIPKTSAGPLSLVQLENEWQGAARLIAARSDSLRRTLAKTPGATQTAAPTTLQSPTPSGAPQGPTSSGVPKGHRRGKGSAD
jgi:ribonuclease P protein component